MIVGFNGAGIKLPRREDQCRRSGGAVQNKPQSIDTPGKARLPLQLSQIALVRTRRRRSVSCRLLQNAIVFNHAIDQQ